ncbi:hypothetical protein NFI96_026260 [Prochilodus magdalenae]|nr:hypothetical protein NFI96_026260 [Prochilodus magdalenae]
MVVLGQSGLRWSPAMATVPSYSPSIWVRMCHALPRFDLTMQMRDNVFTPDSWEYQQLEHPHTVPADGAVGVEVEGHQAFWTCDTKPFISVLTTVPPHTVWYDTTAVFGDGDVVLRTVVVTVCVHVVLRGAAVCRWCCTNRTTRGGHHCSLETLLVLSSLSAIALILSLLVVLSFLIHYCCCHRGDAGRDAEEEEEDDDTSGGHGYSGKKGRNICCVTWVSVAAVTLCCVAIGVGFYGNSEANDGMYQLTSSLLTANYTLASIDLLLQMPISSPLPYFIYPPPTQVWDTVAVLQRSVSGPLTSLEDVFGGSKPALVSTRSCRRLSERVASLLSSLSLGRGVSFANSGPSGANGSDSIVGVLTPAPPSVAPTLTPTSTANSIPTPFSPGWAANTLMVNEDYRWLSYVLLLLLDLVVCLFILLGLAKQARWLLILMTVLAWLALFLSWGSLGLETATVVALSDFCFDPNTFVLNSTHFNTGTSTGASFSHQSISLISSSPLSVTYTSNRTSFSLEILDYYLTCNRRMTSPFQQLLTQSQRALSSIHSHLSSLERDALPRFPKAEKSLREVQQILNVTEGNFHQLVALLNCRGLNKDYIDSLKGLCYDGMEGLLYLSLYSFLSALAFTAILCSLPGAWRSFSRTPTGQLEHPHTVPADGAVGVEVEGRQAFWTCDNTPFILVLTTVPPHTDSLGVSTKTKAGLSCVVQPSADGAALTGGLMEDTTARWMSVVLAVGSVRDSEEYEDSDSESEDPFTSHQARRPTATGSQRGALPPFYSYQGAGWTPPFSSAPPLPTPNASSNGNPGYESLPLSDRPSPPPSDLRSSGPVSELAVVLGGLGHVSGRLLVHHGSRFINVFSRSLVSSPLSASVLDPGIRLPDRHHGLPEVQYSPSMLTGYGGNQSHPNPAHSQNLYSH